MIAERGIAALLEPTSVAAIRRIARRAAFMPGLPNCSNHSATAISSMEFLDNFKVDLFPDEIYLFTPKGKIFALPKNSTALDFAYAVHTDIGNHAVTSRVDKQLMPLRTKLSSGQTVEIITARSALPKPQWLEFVVSSKARTAIRHQLKQLQHEDAVQLGHRMLDRCVGSHGQLVGTSAKGPTGCLPG